MSMNASRVVAEKSNLGLDAARCAQENSNLIGQVSKDIRTMSYLLHPPLLDELGLSSALRWYIEGVAERSKIKWKSATQAEGSIRKFSRRLPLARVPA
jgi:two-component system, NarL family, sensor kinase